MKLKGAPNNIIEWIAVPTYIVQAEKNLALSGGRGRQRSNPTKFVGEGSAGRGALGEQRAGRAGEVDGGTSKYHCECV